LNYPSVIQNRDLQEVLDRARSVGDLGPESNDTVISQSLKFVEAIPPGTAEIADLGSGAGVPGLVLALALPQLQVRLVERSQKRCDGLVLAIGKLGLSDRVKVYCGEAQKVARSAEWPGGVSVVVCRSFSPIEGIFSAAAPLMTPNAILLVSEPPDSDGSRWMGNLPRDFAKPSIASGIALFARK
jgi:16S rRNA G527 N7-methylase RsmG